MYSTHSSVAGWGETEVPMDVSSQRLAPVQHRQDLAARGLLSLFSLLRAFIRTVIKRNQAGDSGFLLFVEGTPLPEAQMAFVILL